MRIVFYSLSTTLYGAPTSLLNLIQGLTKNDNHLQIFVIVPGNGPLTKELKKLPVQVIRLPHYKWVYQRSLFLKEKKYHAWLWYYKNVLQKLTLNFFWLPIHLIKIRSLKPDLIYTNTSLSPIGVIVAKILRIKSIWHHRETINDSETDFFIEWNSTIAKAILNWPDIHIHPSTYLKSTYAPYITTGQTHIVYNGVEAANTDIRKWDIKKGIRFGMVGRISVQKGQEEVIECIRQFENPAISLTIYGGGEKYYIDRLKHKAPSYVFIKGFQPKDEIYKEIHFLIINARNESFGRVVAEAYANGVPVIALSSGALPELVVDGETGFLFTNSESLRVLLKKIISTINENIYETLSINCIHRYKDYYSIEGYSRKIAEILKNRYT